MWERDWEKKWKRVRETVRERERGREKKEKERETETAAVWVFLVNVQKFLRLLSLCVLLQLIPIAVVVIFISMFIVVVVVVHVLHVVVFLSITPWNISAPSPHAHFSTYSSSNWRILCTHCLPYTPSHAPPRPRSANSCWFPCHFSVLRSFGKLFHSFIPFSFHFQPFRTCLRFTSQSCHVVGSGRGRINSWTTERGETDSHDYTHIFAHTRWPPNECSQCKSFIHFVPFANCKKLEKKRKIK